MRYAVKDGAHCRWDRYSSSLLQLRVPHLPYALYCASLIPCTKSGPADHRGVLPCLQTARGVAAVKR